jgi:hypothetical protein
LLLFHQTSEQEAERSILLLHHLLFRWGRTIHALVIDYTLNSASKLIADVLVNPKKEREREKKGRLYVIISAWHAPRWVHWGQRLPKNELAPTSQRNRINPSLYTEKNPNKLKKIWGWM